MAAQVHGLLVLSHPGQPPQRFARHPHIPPLVQKLAAHRPVKLNRRRIPIQHRPLQPRAALFHRNRRHPFQQRFADPQPAHLRLNKDVLQVDSRPHPGRVVVEKQRIARRAAVVLGDQAGIKGMVAKSLPLQARFGRRHGFRRALIGSQRANEVQNPRHIRARCRANRRCHGFMLIQPADGSARSSGHC